MQGQLEHPSIVPVYDLGVGADGAALLHDEVACAGLTLAEVLDGLARATPALTDALLAAKAAHGVRAACASRRLRARARRAPPRSQARATSCSATSARCTCSTGASPRSSAARTSVEVGRGRRRARPRRRARDGHAGLHVARASARDVESCSTRAPTSTRSA